MRSAAHGPPKRNLDETAGGHERFLCTLLHGSTVSLVNLQKPFHLGGSLCIVLASSFRVQPFVAEVIGSEFPGKIS
jgi:hypothetical protein